MYSEMTVFEPPFHRGPLHMLSLPQNPLHGHVVETKDEKEPFQPLFKKLVKSWLFKKANFQLPFRQFSRIQPWDQIWCEKLKKAKRRMASS
jgi:hypothetical protein